MIAHDCQKLTLVNLREYGPHQALVGGFIYGWTGKGFRLVRVSSLFLGGLAVESYGSSA